MFYVIFTAHRHNSLSKWMHGLSHCCCCCAIAGSYRSAEVTLPLLMNLLHIKMYHEIFRLTSCNTPQLVLRTWLPLTRNLLLFPSQHYGNVDDLQPGCVACLLILLASLNTRTLTYFIYIYIWNGVCAHIIEQINLIANLGCCFLCMYDAWVVTMPSFGRTGNWTSHRYFLLFVCEVWWWI